MPAEYTFKLTIGIYNFCMKGQMKHSLVWIITEGLAGTENQCLGVARSLGVTPVVKRLDLRFPWSVFSPWLGFENRHSFTPGSDPLDPPYPDLIIAAGRKAVAPVRYVQKRAKGTVSTVFLQNPYISPAQFDLVAAPAHDNLKGDNVIRTTAAPNRITAERLNRARDEFAHLFRGLPTPRVAVLIGGSSKSYAMGEDDVRAFCALLRNAALHKDAGLMVTTSRRTGGKNETIIQNILGELGDRAYIWSGEGANPYFGMLAWADIICVTEDSVSMTAEAATTGKPVYRLPLAGGSPKFADFHARLDKYGATRPFEGIFEFWSYPPLDDAGLVAKEIRRRGLFH